MKTYIITGTSSGLGLALAKELLRDANNRVFGMSRKDTLRHERYTHITVDFSDPRQVTELTLPLDGTEEAVFLINNAGWIGEIAPLGSAGFDHQAITRSFHINLVAPTILINQFISQVRDFSGRRVILNISSGAGRYPVKAWSTYCSSKAGIDMLTRVINEEHPEIECYALAPGIVETPMQEAIRNANPEHFPDLERFRGYHESGDLRPAEEVAAQIADLLANPKLIPNALFSLRDF
jgi:benzil reductase ((S)-benzoin forming)